MIEKTVLDFLSAKISVPVWLETPCSPPECFVLLEKTGGHMEEGLCHATLAIQSHGRTLLDALQLNQTVKKAMEHLDDLDSVCRVSLNSDYHFSDPTTKRRRYQAVFDVMYYEE